MMEGGSSGSGSRGAMAVADSPQPSLEGGEGTGQGRLVAEGVGLGQREEVGVLCLAAAQGRCDVINVRAFVYSDGDGDVGGWLHPTTITTHSHT